MKPLAFILLLLLPIAAFAHHAAEPRMRIVLIAEEGGDTIVYVRLPAPLLFAEALSGRQNPADRVDVPFLHPVAHRSGWAHYLDASQIREDAAGFARMAAGAFAITLNGEPVVPEATAAAVHSLNTLPRFATPDEAEVALDAGGPDENLFVGHGFVDARLRLRGTGDLALRSTVDGLELPSDVFLENLIVDYRTDPPVEFARIGVWTEAIALDIP